jgi:uncharacterized membrane protein
MFDILSDIIGNSNSNDAPTNVSTFEMVLGMVVNFFLAVGSSLFLVGLSVSLVQFITSAGDPKAIDKAKNAITWTVVAGIVTILSIAIKVALLHSAGVTEADLVNDNPTFQ